MCSLKLLTDKLCRGQKVVRFGNQRQLLLKSLLSALARSPHWVEI
jgi:hypothetical protein